MADRQCGYAKWIKARPANKYSCKVKCSVFILWAYQSSASYVIVIVDAPLKNWLHQWKQSKKKKSVSHNPHKISHSSLKKKKSATKYEGFSHIVSCSALRHSSINTPNSIPTCWQTHIYTSFQPADEILIDWWLGFCLSQRGLPPCIWHPTVSVLKEKAPNKTTASTGKFHSHIISISWSYTLLQRDRDGGRTLTGVLAAHEARRCDFTCSFFLFFNEEMN